MLNNANHQGEANLPLSFKVIFRPKEEKEKCTRVSSGPTMPRQPVRVCECVCVEESGEGGRGALG